MRVQITRNPSMSAHQMHQKCQSFRNLSISTIQKSLRDYLGFKVHVAADKPPLTEKMRQSRLDFCEEYGSMSQGQW